METQTQTQTEAMRRHFAWRGKIEIAARAPLADAADLSLAYTPGVAEPCLAIQKDPALSFELTRRWNTVAVVTDGSAVLGLGDIGPEAGMPVMEGKCALFKRFGGVDAIPLCVRTKDADEIARAAALLAGSFGGINLEDIAAPRCFAIEQKLKETCDIPVFHDDQHGTAVVTLAGLTNAMKLTNRRPETARVVIVGAGAAGSAIAWLLLKAGYTDIVVCGRNGILAPRNSAGEPFRAQLAAATNPRRLGGALADACRGADVLIGVSGPGVVTPEMVASMNTDAIVFAMANPVPEIWPDAAQNAGARVVATGRSDFPNQINNVLAFPGIFRGALDVRASDINGAMNLAAAQALADLAADETLSSTRIIPSPFDPRVAPAVARAAAEAARVSGVARI